MSTSTADAQPGILHAVGMLASEDRSYRGHPQNACIGSLSISVVIDLDQDHRLAILPPKGSDRCGVFAISRQRRSTSSRRHRPVPAVSTAAAPAAVP